VLPKSHIVENRRSLRAQIILVENQNAPQVNLARHLFLAFANGGLGNTPFRRDPHFICLSEKTGQAQYDPIFSCQSDFNLEMREQRYCAPDFCARNQMLNIQI
jgi:hypothetical protein